jgi:hypothetical protein
MRGLSCIGLILQGIDVVLVADGDAGGAEAPLVLAGVAG